MQIFASVTFAELRGASSSRIAMTGVVARIDRSSAAPSPTIGA